MNPVVEAPARRRPDTGRGILYGTAAHGLWGVFPLYFRLLADSTPLEVVLHRVLWSLLVCLLIVAAVRGWAELRFALGTRRRVLILAAAAGLLAVNWGVYIYAVNSGHVVEASLGYFINPLVTVLLGVVILRERLRPAQWVAVGIGALAVVVLTLDYGRLPWISLSLAFSFGIYALLKNRLGAHLGALASLTAEAMVLAPLAAGALVWLELTGRGHFTAGGPWHAVLLASTGVATVIPLLCFAAAARRIPLSTLGLLQYLTPVLQLLCGVLLLGERMAASRWFGFSIVWLALLVLGGDSLRAARRRATTINLTTCQGPATVGH
jgi:chloramphenicol-sensitive protein RarD